MENKEDITELFKRINGTCDVIEEVAKRMHAIYKIVGRGNCEEIIWSLKDDSKKVDNLRTKILCYRTELEGMN